MKPFNVFLIGHVKTGGTQYHRLLLKTLAKIFLFFPEELWSGWLRFESCVFTLARVTNLWFLEMFEFHHFTLTVCYELL